MDLQAPFPFVSDSGPGPLCKQVTARVKTSQAAEAAAGASGSLSGGNPPTLVYREAPGHEGRLESLENFLSRRDNYIEHTGQPPKKKVPRSVVSGDPREEH